MGACACTGRRIKISMMNKRILLSEEMHELIGNRPPWVIRNGSLFFLFLLVAVVAASWCIRVPAVVHGSLSVSSRGDQRLGRMKVASALRPGPGQRVMIRAAGVGAVVGTVESVSRTASLAAASAASSAAASSGDSCWIEMRLAGGSMPGGSKPLLFNAEFIIHQRLFDRWWGMARLWYR